MFVAVRIRRPGWRTAREGHRPLHARGRPIGSARDLPSDAAFVRLRDGVEARPDPKRRADLSPSLPLARHDAPPREQYRARRILSAARPRAVPRRHRARHHRRRPNPFPHHLDLSGATRRRGALCANVLLRPPTPRRQRPALPQPRRHPHARQRPPDGARLALRRRLDGRAQGTRSQTARHHGHESGQLHGGVDRGDGTAPRPSCSAAAASSTPITTIRAAPRSVASSKPSAAPRRCSPNASLQPTR